MAPLNSTQPSSFHSLAHYPCILSTTPLIMIWLQSLRLRGGTGQVSHYKPIGIILGIHSGLVIGLSLD